MMYIYHLIRQKFDKNDVYLLSNSIELTKFDINVVIQQKCRFKSPIRSFSRFLSSRIVLFIVSNRISFISRRPISTSTYMTTFDSVICIDNFVIFFVIRVVDDISPTSRCLCESLLRGLQTCIVKYVLAAILFLSKWY